MSQRPGPKPTPKKPLPKPQPKPTPNFPPSRPPRPTPPSGPYIPPSQGGDPIPPRGGPRGLADEKLPPPIPNQTIPTPSSPTKRNPGKEIIVNFAGGEYGAVNDAAADKIAKKYNLEITKRPEKNDPTPIYLFSVKGDVGSNLSGIRNESGVRYVEPNSRSFIPEVGPDPIIEWEDNTMRAALAGKPLPPKPTQLPIPPRGGPRGLADEKLPPLDFPPYDRSIPSGEMPLQPLQQQTYGDMLAKAIAQQQAFGGFIPTPAQPTPVAQPSTQPTTPTIPVPQARQNQQAMQNYTNLLNQGLANYQAQTGQPTFGQPKQQTPRNISTAGFPTPKPFG